MVSWLLELEGHLINLNNNPALEMVNKFKKSLIHLYDWCTVYVVLGKCLLSDEF